VHTAVTKGKKPALQSTWQVKEFRAELAADGVYVLQSNRVGPYFLFPSNLNSAMFSAWGFTS
jgi:hypothetical protein